MRTIWITGAAGFTGRHLARRLRLEGPARIIGFDRAGPGTLPEFDRMLELDMPDLEALQRYTASHRPDWVFHLAGMTQGSFDSVIRVNLRGAVSLLEALRRGAPDARTLLVGSSAEYGRVAEADMPIGEDHPCHPFTAYGISKHAATLTGLSFASEAGMMVTVARPFNAVGPGIGKHLLVGALLERARLALASDEESPAIRVGNLDSERDFVAVDDLVDGFVRQIQGETSGQVFNLCSGAARSIRSVIDALFSHAPRPLRLEVDPELIRPGEVRTLVGDGRRAQEAFGFRSAASLDRVLAETWEEAMGAEVSHG